MSSDHSGYSSPAFVDAGTLNSCAEEKCQRRDPGAERYYACHSTLHRTQVEECLLRHHRIGSRAAAKVSSRKLPAMIPQGHESQPEVTNDRRRIEPTNIRVVGHADSRSLLRSRALKSRQQIEHLDSYLEALFPKTRPSKVSVSDSIFTTRSNWRVIDYLTRLISGTGALDGRANPLRRRPFIFQVPCCKAD